MDDLQRIARSLEQLAIKPLALPIVEALAETWIDEARDRMGIDTGQLYARTNIVSMSSTGGSAKAELQADTPYAGYHNYGTRYQAPNRFWNRGRDAALAEADRLGGKVATMVARSLQSGGSWNPRSLQ